MEDNLNSWIFLPENLNLTTGEKYLVCLYWISQTVITVGYGDVPNNTATEHILSIIAMFAGVIFFSLTIGSLTSIISDMDTKNTEYERKLNVLLKIKKEYDVSEEFIMNLQKCVKYEVYRGEQNFTEFLND
jgi:hypothetical protein